MALTAEYCLAAAPSTTRGQATQLSADPKGERIAYASNKSVFLRSINNPANSTQYTAHTTTTTVARFSPSGYYVASGDVAGTVRVWDCVGEGSTKGEYHIISGKINDLAWDGDSQRIIAVGDGKEKYGACITSDSGNSVGEISGHSSQVNAVSIRQQRPLRAATGSDDLSLGFYHGVPFKFNTSLRGKHSRFIYGVAFSPDGSSLVSVGADSKITLYDGKTGEVKGQIGDAEHKGSIFGISWAKDSKRFCTSSADQCVKIWDVDTGRSTQTWRMGEEGTVSVPHHQVGVVWPAGRSDGLILSLGLCGDLNYLVEGSREPQKVVQGHQKSITSIDVSNDAKTLWTGSSEGRVCCWDSSTGTGETVDGETHTNYVSAIVTSPEGPIYSVGWDDTLRTLDAAAKTFLGSSSKTNGQPKGVALLGNQAIVVTHKGLEVFIDGKVTGELQTKYTPTSIAASGETIAVGGDDNTLHILSHNSTSFSPQKEIPEPASLITALAFSPDAKMLAVGFSNGKISVYSCADWGIAISRWSSHTGRITSIAWNKASTYAVSSSLDSNIFVWSVAKPGMRVNVANAHKDGVNGVVFFENDTKIASVGSDAAVKTWKLGDLA